MANTSGVNGVWRWISGILASALMGGFAVVVMLGSDRISTEEFSALRSDVQALAVKQAETATALDGLRSTIERHSP